MKNFKISRESVGTTLKNGAGVVIGVALCVLPYLDSVKGIVESIRYNCGNATYSDAVNAVLTSGMYSSSIDEAIAVIPTNGDSELYKSIIQVAKADTYSSSKVNIIKNICGKGEEA